MSTKDTTTTAVEIIEKRLAEITPQLEELQAESDKLQAGLAALTGKASAPKASGRPRRASGGPTVAEKILPIVKESPGISVPELAEQVGVEKSYLYNVTARLKKSGQLDRVDEQWVVPA